MGVPLVAEVSLAGDLPLAGVDLGVPLVAEVSLAGDLPLAGVDLGEPLGAEVFLAGDLPLAGDAALVAGELLAAPLGDFAAASALAGDSLGLDGVLAPFAGDAALGAFDEEAGDFVAASFFVGLFVFPGNFFAAAVEALSLIHI